MIKQTEIMNIKKISTEDHYMGEPIEALITAYLIHQGNTMLIQDENQRNALVSQIIKGENTFRLGDYAYLIKGENISAEKIWSESARVKKAEA